MTTLADEQAWLEVGAARLHAVRWRASEGSPGGAPLLLVHGLGGNTISWDLVGRPLAEHLDVDVHAVDLPGFGRSTVAPPNGAVARYDRLLDRLVDDLGGRVVLVGNSMGGSLGVRLAARRPEAFAALVLVDAALPQRLPRPGRLPFLAWQGVRFGVVSIPRVGPRVFALRNRRLGPERAVDATLRLVAVAPDRLDAGQRERLVAMAAERDGRADALHAHVEAARWVLGYTAAAMRRDLAVVARTVPTLIVHGAHDRLVPVSSARAAARRHPELALAVLECGHVPQMECPYELVATVAGWVRAAGT